LRGLKKKEIAKLLGTAYLEMGRDIQGVQTILPHLSYNASDKQCLEALLPALHMQNLHFDIVSLMRQYETTLFSSNGSILFYYGYALYETENYREALDVLTLVRSYSVRPEFLQVMALSYEKLSENSEGQTRNSYLSNALIYIEMAYRGDRSDSAIREDYLRLLSKTGNYSKATEVLVQ
jgi:hypothetical protein